MSQLPDLTIQIISLFIREEHDQAKKMLAVLDLAKVLDSLYPIGTKTWILNFRGKEITRGKEVTIESTFIPLLKDKKVKVKVDSEWRELEELDLYDTAILPEEMKVKYQKQYNSWHGIH
jgi:hypothetical protein